MNKNNFVRSIIVVVFVIMFIIDLAFFAIGQDGDDRNFEVNPFFIKSVLESGDFISHKLTIKNFGESQTFRINSNADFISIDEKKLTLGEGESGEVDIIMNSLDYETGVYIGEIIISEEINEVTVPVVLEIHTAFPLFDTSIETPQDLSVVVPGGDFVADVNVFKLKGQSNVVNLEYLVRDIKGNTIFFEEQTLNVDRQAKVTKTIHIPEDAIGNHVFSVIAKDINSISTGTSSLLFSVAPILPPESDKTGFNNYILRGSFGIIVILIIVFLIFNYFWNRKLIDNAKHWDKKLVEIKRVKLGDVAKAIKKLEYQKSTLERAYNKKYIKRKSYEEGKKAINELIRKLKKRL